MNMNNKTNFSNALAGAYEHTENPVYSLGIDSEGNHIPTVHAISIKEMMDVCFAISGYITGEYSDDQFDHELLQALPPNLYQWFEVHVNIWNVFKDCVEYRNKMSKFFNELPIICELSTIREYDDGDLRYEIAEWDIGHWRKSYFHREAFLLGWSEDKNPIIRYKGTKYEAFNIKDCSKDPNSPYYEQAVKVLGVYAYPESQPARNLYETEPMFLVKTDKEPVINN